MINTDHLPVTPGFFLQAWWSSFLALLDDIFNLNWLLLRGNAIYSLKCSQYFWKRKKKILFLNHCLTWCKLSQANGHIAYCILKMITMSKMIKKRMTMIWFDLAGGSIDQPGFGLTWEDSCDAHTASMIIMMIMIMIMLTPHQWY